MRKSMTVAVAMMCGTLAQEIGELEERVRNCRNYIDDAHQRHDDLIATLDDIIRGQKEDHNIDTSLVGVHDRLVSDWPEKPYFMRRDY